MLLATPVTLEVLGETLILNALRPTFVDNTERRVVLAQLYANARPLVLWRDAAYDAVGDWTEAQAAARIIELLGENQQASLQALARA